MTNPMDDIMQSEPEKSSSQRPWLHWGIVVALLYVAIFAVLTLPVLMACFPTDFTKHGIKEFFELYAECWYWIPVGIVALSQFLFLRVPVRLTVGRPVSRASIWLPVIVSGFWFGCLTLGGVVAVIEFLKYQHSDWPLLATSIAVISWIVWAIVFFRISRAKDPKDIITQQSRWLLRGSILELLIAVPSHIVARGRADCCAGILTFFGITMGLSVMLLSFGPAVFLLYYARWKRLHPGQ